VNRKTAVCWKETTPKQFYIKRKNSKKIEKFMIEMKKKDCICNIFGSSDHFLNVNLL